MLATAYTTNIWCHNTRCVPPISRCKDTEVNLVCSFMAGDSRWDCAWGNSVILESQEEVRWRLKYARTSDILVLCIYLYLSMYVCVRYVCIYWSAVQFEFFAPLFYLPVVFIKFSFYFYLLAFMLHSCFQDFQSTQ